MRGYWGSGPGRGRTVGELIDTTATAAVLAADGWLTTGDFGLLTPEGNLQLSGRAHERYIRGGYNVYPAEVEEVLSLAPRRGAGRRGRRARRRARRDRRGRRRGAATGAAPELAGLRAHCAERLSDYKAPDALVVVDELPLTPMMKVDPAAWPPWPRGAAEERRSRRERNRGPAPGVLGSGPTGQADEKERA